MTLIGIGCFQDHATVVTDTMASDGGGRRLATTSKTFVVQHLDAAFTARGAKRFGRQWFTLVHALEDRASTFDELVEVLSPHLPAVQRAAELSYEQENADGGMTGGLSPSTGYAVGYSHARERFRALAFSTENGCRFFDLDDAHVEPSPFDVRPSDWELGRIAAAMAADPQQEDASMLQEMRSLPALELDDTPQGWGELAARVRAQRSNLPAGTGLKGMIGGALVATTLRRGLAVQATIGAFDDTGASLAAMMGGTLHPFGQVGPCECGSGKRYIDCHLPTHEEESCVCGSGAALGRCCMLTGDEAAHWSRTYDAAVTG
jgi:hypothetical protein